MLMFILIILGSFGRVIIFEALVKTMLQDMKVLHHLTSIQGRLIHVQAFSRVLGSCQSAFLGCLVMMIEVHGFTYWKRATVQERLE